MELVESASASDGDGPGDVEIEEEEEDEVTAGLRRELIEAFSCMDANGDGTVTKAELYSLVKAIGVPIGMVRFPFLFDETRI